LKFALCPQVRFFINLLEHPSMTVLQAFHLRQGYGGPPKL